MVISLQAEGISLAMMPERGGKITSILDCERGREWLERASGELNGPADVDRSFDEGDMCGWDEMMPTISSCRYPGTNVWLPDHGELWTKPWDVTDISENSIATRVAGHALAYRFDRTVSLGVRSVHVAYRVTNEGTSDLHFLWAAHPLFSVLPTTKVLMHDTGDAGELREVGDTAPVTWPRTGVSVADALVHGAAKKLFARAVPGVVRVSLVDGDGGSLSLRWTGSEVPWVGIWLDNCSLSRRPVVAIEPTNASDDSLEVAERVGQFWVLTPGATRSWSLDATVSGTGATTQ